MATVCLLPSEGASGASNKAGTNPFPTNPVKVTRVSKIQTQTTVTGYKITGAFRQLHQGATFCVTCKPPPQNGMTVTRDPKWIPYECVK